MRKFIYVLLFMVLSVSLFAQPTTSTLIRRAELGDSTAALRTFINLLGPTDSTTFRAYSNSLYLYKTDTTSIVAMQWELNLKLWTSDTTNFRTFSDIKYILTSDTASVVAMQWELDGKASKSQNNNFTVGQTITGNSAIVGTTGSPQLTIGTPNATAASSNQFFDKWDIYNPILAMYKTTNDWHGTFQTQLQLDSAAYGFSKTAHLTDAYLSTKLRVGSTDTVHNSASGGSSSLSLDVVDGAQFVGNSDTTMGAFPTTYLTGHRGEINFRRWNKRAINTGLNPNVLSAYLATVNFDNVDSTHIQKVGGYTNIMSYSPPHVVIDTAIGFWSKAPANINGTLSNFYHFYGEGDYPSYFGGKLQAGSYSQNSNKSGLADLSVKGIARIEDYGSAGLTISGLIDGSGVNPYLGFDVDSVNMASIYWDNVNSKLIFNNSDLTGFLSTFVSTVEIGSYSQNILLSSYSFLVKGIARIQDYGSSGLTINSLTDGSTRDADGNNSAYLGFDIDSVNVASAYWDSVNTQLVFGKSATTGFLTHFVGAVSFGTTNQIDSISVVGDSLRIYTGGKWGTVYLHNSFDSLLWIPILLGILITYLIKKRYEEV